MSIVHLFLIFKELLQLKAKGMIFLSIQKVCSVGPNSYWAYSIVSALIDFQPRVLIHIMDDEMVLHSPSPDRYSPCYAIA
jgi:hypothetical protein